MDERRSPKRSDPKPATSTEGGLGKRPDAGPEKQSDDFAERAATGGFTPKLPEVTLPKSGGSIRALGEKFSVAAATGTGNFSLPLPLSPARMTPPLRLSYNSGAGNGIFGFGWTLDLPAVRRKTDKGLPQYDDLGESDVYILSGAEDLVPVLDTNGDRKPVSRTVFGVHYQIAYYRPRIEGLFARIERWRATESGIIHWRTITRDNVVTLYGDGPDSRVADPVDSGRIFEWRISRTFDDKGNATFYVYAHEDGVKVTTTSAHEANRTGDSAARKSQTYLRKVLYGNRTPYVVDFTAQAEPASPPPKDWMFALSLDYGDHTGDGVDPDGSVWPVPVRPDPFSTYRSGFEIRTYRRVQRLLFFNNFPDEPSVGAYGLVRSIDLTYSDLSTPPDPNGPIYTFLVKLQQTGYREDAGGLHVKSLPPLEFDYTQARLDPNVRAVDRESLGNLPEGVDGSRYRWLDLDGEGLSGILSPADGAWYFKRNLSAANVAARVDKRLTATPLFGPIREIAETPGHGDVKGRQFLALDADGMVDVVALSGSEPGFYARTPDRDFAPFKRFKFLTPNRLERPEPQVHRSDGRWARRCVDH